MRARMMVELLCLQILLVISASPVWAQCLKPPLSAQSISEFKANPQGLVAPNSDTRTIEAVTRDLAASDASLAADLVRVAESTIPRYQTAIAAGLAQAAIACSTVDQQAGLLIQQAVASYQDGQFQASFAAVAGDLSTAAAAAASSYATSSFGSVVVVNPNSAPRLNVNPGEGGNTALVLFASPAVNITTTNVTAATAASPVSPTR
jgi:hypothetical protein